MIRRPATCTLEAKHPLRWVNGRRVEMLRFVPVAHTNSRPSAIGGGKGATSTSNSVAPTVEQVRG